MEKTKELRYLEGDWGWFAQRGTGSMWEAWTEPEWTSPPPPPSVLRAGFSPEPPLTPLAGLPSTTEQTQNFEHILLSSSHRQGPTDSKSACRWTVLDPDWGRGSRKTMFGSQPKTRLLTLFTVSCHAGAFWPPSAFLRLSHFSAASELGKGKNALIKIKVFIR